MICGAAGTGGGGGGGDAGITGSSAWDTALAVPATSVAFAVRTWVPLDRALVVMLQVPVELVVPVPTTVLPSYTVMLLLASAVPDS